MWAAATEFQPLLEKIWDVRINWKAIMQAESSCNENSTGDTSLNTQNGRTYGYSVSHQVRILPGREKSVIRTTRSKH